MHGNSICFLSSKVGYIDQLFRGIVIQIHSHLTENKEMTRTGERNNLRLVLCIIVTGQNYF